MNKLEEILSLVRGICRRKSPPKKSWEEGDWINYSGPNFSSDEYAAAVKTLLDGWLVIGRKI